ncbi:hypothetical protein AB837_00063 [bacterium AB1]|nr:hypothetical protein AB837_00063 [bacterium AB1]
MFFIKKLILIIFLYNVEINQTNNNINFINQEFYNLIFNNIVNIKLPERDNNKKLNDINYINHFLNLYYQNSKSVELLIKKHYFHNIQRLYYIPITILKVILISTMYNFESLQQNAYNCFNIADLFSINHGQIKQINKLAQIIYNERLAILICIILFFCKT